MRVPRHVNTYGYTASKIASSDKYRVVYTNGNTGNWIGGTVSQQEQHRSLRETPKTGGRIGSFRKPTAWSMLATRTEYTSYSYRYRTSTRYDREGYGGNASHGVGKPSYFTAYADRVVVNVDANLVARARTEALIKIKDMNVNVGVALAESKQTLGFIVSIVSRLVKAIRYARRGDWVRAGHALGYKHWRNGRSQANSWLEYQYGFLPLVSDLYGLQQQLKDGFRNKDQLFKVSRQVTSALNPRDFISPVAGSLTLKEVTGQAAQVVKVVYYQKVSNESLAGLEQLGLTNPALIAWELVPFSFVIDWLIPIGTFLEALTATLGMSFTGGYEDRIVHANVRWSHNIGTLISGTPYQGHFRQMAFQRLVHLTWASPVPYWKNPFTATHVISAIALVAQLRK